MNNDFLPITPEEARSRGWDEMEILESLNDKGHTVVLVTHETQTAEFANRIIRIKDGMVESDKLITANRIHRGNLK